jgi:hypothetical protein
MAYIFLDESGDLGFNFKKKKTSKIFVVTCLFTENKKPIFRKYEYGDDSYYYFLKKQNPVRYLRATIRKPTHEDLLAILQYSKYQNIMSIANCG